MHEKETKRIGEEKGAFGFRVGGWEGRGGGGDRGKSFAGLLNEGENKQ